MFIRHRHIDVQTGELAERGGNFDRQHSISPEVPVSSPPPSLSDAPLFITFCAAGPLVLPEEARDLVLNDCLRECGVRVELYAAVVMPDHVHLLFTALRNENGWAFLLVEIMQSLKGATAHRINKLLHRSGPVWEEESFDHVLRSDEFLEEKREYIRQNPVKAGLVQTPEDYRWLWLNPNF